MTYWKSFLISYQTYLGTLLLLCLGLFFGLTVIYLIMRAKQKSKEKLELRQRMFAELLAHKKEK